MVTCRCVSVTDATNGDGCTVDGQTFQQDQMWRPEPCRVCVCQEGVAVCQQVQCEPLSHCHRVTTPQGACCPVCDTFAAAGGIIGEQMCFVFSYVCELTSDRK